MHGLYDTIDQNRRPTGKVGGLDAIDAISGDLSAPAEFPVDALPTPCRILVEEIAAAVVCPPDFAAVPMLVMLGSAIGNARVLKLKEGWEEGAAIYAAIVAHPGDKKTPAMRLGTEAAWRKQADLKRGYDEARDEYERELREYEVQRKEAFSNGLAAPPPPREPVMERTVVEDTTTEALMVILGTSPRGVMQVRDELSGWVRAMDQYKSGGKGADRQLYLSAWSNSPVVVDRKGRDEPLFCQRPFVGRVGTIQPGVLKELGGGREDGLLDRFLFGYPAPARSRWSDAEVSRASRLGVARLYERLRDLNMPVDDNGDPEPKRVGFSPDAKEVFVQEVDELRREMESPRFPVRLRGPWAKLEGYLARLTLVLAVCRSVEDGTPERVEPRDVLAAVALVGYFKSHARKVHEELYGSNPSERLTEDVAEFLAEHGGRWKGEPSEFHRQLESTAKPGDAGWLIRKLEEVARRTPSLDLQIGNFWKDGQSRRFVEITLRNGVNGVNDDEENLDSGPTESVGGSSGGGEWYTHLTSCECDQCQVANARGLK